MIREQGGVQEAAPFSIFGGSQRHAGRSEFRPRRIQQLLGEHAPPPYAVSRCAYFRRGSERAIAG
jgi:hypothetical protein